MDQDYLRISQASDLKNPKERALFRFLEILPGAINWLTLIGAVALSYFKPAFVAFFMIIFALYWFLRAIYFSFYMKAGYKRMKKEQKIDWIKKLKKMDSNSISSDLPVRDWQEVYHLIILPMYKEPYAVVRDSIFSLSRTNYPKERMIVVLALEERGGTEPKRTAQRLQEEIGDKFFKFLITVHPDNLPNEIIGKGSNETWAAREAKNFLDEMAIDYKKVIFSSFDIDSVVGPNYFSCLTYHYLTTKKPLRTSFQPIPLFLNNVWQAPAISRLFSFSTTFWHITNQERQEKLITFSSHSMPFYALNEIGFKQTNVVSDDSRIFWQCFLFYDGDYRTEPMFTPISMDVNVAKNFWRTMVNVYKQQRRWAYGVAEIPYFLFNFRKNKKIPFKKKFALGFEVIESHWSWACASILLFILGWMPKFIGGYRFNQSLFSYNFSRLTGKILTLAMVGLISYMYYTYYILPPKPGKTKKGFNVALASLQWLLLPFTMVFFTSLPALDAQTRLMLGRYMGFWPTPKHRNTEKPQDNKTEK